MSKTGDEEVHAAEPVAQRVESGQTQCLLQPQHQPQLMRNIYQAKLKLAKLSPRPWFVSAQVGGARSSLTPPPPLVYWFCCKGSITSVGFRIFIFFFHFYLDLKSFSVVLKKKRNNYKYFQTTMIHHLNGY